jgi:hypothetical protein
MAIQSVSTFNLVVGTFFALSDVNNTKKRLVDGEALGECAEQMRMAKHANRCELLRELIEADVDVHQNRPVAGVAVERGDMGADGMLQPGGSLGATIIGGFLQQRVLKLRCVSEAKPFSWRIEPTYNNTVAINKSKNERAVFLEMLLGGKNAHKAQAQLTSSRCVSCSRRCICSTDFW